MSRICKSKYLARYSVWFADLVTPVTSSDGNNRQFGQDDGTSNRGGHFLTALDAETDVSVLISDCHERLETRPLTGPRLLLDWHNFQDLKRNHTND